LNEIKRELLRAQKRTPKISKELKRAAKSS
jgi:hypothetical protein